MSMHTPGRGPKAGETGLNCSVPVPDWSPIHSEGGSPEAPEVGLRRLAGCVLGEARACQGAADQRPVGFKTWDAFGASMPC